MAEAKVTADPNPKLYSQAEINDALDRDRIDGFMLFVRGMGEKTGNGLIYGTVYQAQSIYRALKKAGY